MSNKLFSASDFKWIMLLIGTAIGGGVLYLPLKIGNSGYIPIIVSYFIIIPIMYFSQVYLSTLFFKHVNRGSIVSLITSKFSKYISFLILAVYGLQMITPTLFLNISLTNIFSQYVLAFGIGDFYIYIAICLGFLLYIFSILRLDSLEIVNKYLVYILLFSLVLFTVYIVLNYSLSNKSYIDDNYVGTIWDSSTILIQSFSSSQALYLFSKYIKNNYKNETIAIKKIKSILFFSIFIMVTIVMLFVLFSILSIESSELNFMKSNNMHIISYFALYKDSNLLIKYLIPIITTTAIITSLIVCYLGSVDLLKELFFKFKVSMIGIELIFILLITVITITNPSILKLIGLTSGPSITFTLLVLPFILDYKYRVCVSKLQNVTIISLFLLGLLSLFSIFLYII